MTPKTKSQDVRAAERRRAAWALKRGGASYEQIGQRLDVSNAQAWRDIHRRLDEFDEEEKQEAKLFRRAIVERDEGIILAVYPQALRGDLEAVRALILIHRELRELFGLDAPDVVVGDPEPLRLLLEALTHRSGNGHAPTNGALVERREYDA